MEQNYFSQPGNYGNASSDGEHRITQEHTGRTKQSLPDVGDYNMLSFTTILPSESTASQTMPSPSEDESFFLSKIKHFCYKVRQKPAPGYYSACGHFQIQFNDFMRYYAYHALGACVLLIYQTDILVYRTFFPQIVMSIIAFPTVCYYSHIIYFQWKFDIWSEEYDIFLYNMEPYIDSIYLRHPIAVFGYLVGCFTACLLSFVVTNTHISLFVFFLFPNGLTYLMSLISLSDSFSQAIYWGLRDYLWSITLIMIAFHLEISFGWVYLPIILALSALTDWAFKAVTHINRVATTPPAPRLVGIEPNPGPPWRIMYESQSMVICTNEGFINFESDEILFNIDFYHNGSNYVGPAPYRGHLAADYIELSAAQQLMSLTHRSQMHLINSLLGSEYISDVSHILLLHEQKEGFPPPYLIQLPLQITDTRMSDAIEKIREVMDDDMSMRDFCRLAEEFDYPDSNSEDNGSELEVPPLEYIDGDIVSNPSDDEDDAEPVDFGLDIFGKPDCHPSDPDFFEPLILLAPLSGRTLCNFAQLFRSGNVNRDIYAFSVTDGCYTTEYRYDTYLYRAKLPEEPIVAHMNQSRMGHFTDPFPFSSEFQFQPSAKLKLGPLPFLDFEFTQTTRLPHMRNEFDNCVKMPLANTMEASKFLKDGLVPVYQSLRKDLDDWLKMYPDGNVPPAARDWQDAPWTPVVLRVHAVRFHIPGRSFVVPFLNVINFHPGRGIEEIAINILGGLPALLQMDLIVEDSRPETAMDMPRLRDKMRMFMGYTFFSNDMKGYKKLLVGIETNPGPQNDLMKYLKNMESLPLTDSTRRSRSNFHRNAQKRLNKQNAKTIEKLRRKTENIKTEYFGEGLFDVGIDEESRNFIGEAIGQIREVFAQGANLKVDLGLQGALVDIISGAKRIGGLIYDFIIFLIRSFIDMIPEHVSDVVVSVLTLLVGDIFSIDVEDVETYEYVGEGLISSSVYAAYSSFLAKYIPEADMISIWKSGLRYKNLAKDSAPMFAWFFSMLKKIIFYLNEKFPTLIHLPGCLFSSDIAFYFKSLQVIRDGIRSGSVPPHQLAMMVFALQDKIEMDFKENPKSVDSASYSYLLSTIGALAKFFESHVAPRSGCRNEALGIMVTGPTNVGKSTFAMPLLLAILARTKEGDALRDFLNDHFGTVFFRIALNEFWDGMMPLTHRVIVYDDFGQLTDSVGTPNLDALEWIRLKNTAPFHLHYSAIENKMKHYATPDILFGSTNRPFMKFDSIISNEALTRRFDIPVCQLPKAKYCKKGTVTSNPWTRRMDMDKIRKDFPLDPLDASTYAESSVLEYIEWDFLNGKPKQGGFIFSFDELVEYAAKMLISFQERGKHMLNYHDHIKQKFGNITLENSKVDDVQVVAAIGDPKSDSCMKILNEMIGKVEEEQNIFDSTYKVALDHWKPISSTLVMICGATSLYSAFAAWKMESPGRGKPTKKGGKKSYNAGKVKYVVHDPNTPMPYEHFDKEGAEPGQKADYLFKIARRNQYFLTVNGEKKALCQVVFVCERIFMLPRHSFESLTNHYEKQCEDAQSDVQFTIELHGIISKQVEIAFELCDIAGSWGHNEKDLVLVKLPRETCRLHSNIIGAFLKREESDSQQNYYSHTIFYRPEMESHIVCPVTVSYSTCRYNAEGDWNARLNYNAPSAKADCGAPIVCQDPRFARPVILGFHVAGKSGIMSKSCLAMEIFQEDFENPLKYLKGDLNFTEVHPPMEAPRYELEGFSTYGEVPTLYLPSKTCLEPTPFFGKITEVTTFPAPLTKFTKNGVTIDPAALARDKYIHPEVSINREALLRAVATVKKMILPAYDNAPWEPKVLTFEEAICGIPGVDFVDAINRSTSPGYPFVLNRKLPGKKDWLGTAEPTDINCAPVQALKLEIEEIIQCMIKGQRLFFPFVDHLKDERRTKEKCDAGKTRQFMVGNMHLTIIIKMYFGDYIRHICSNRIRNGIAIGMDPYTEWDFLYTHMTALYESLMTAGDYSTYDAKIPVPISMGGLSVADAYYYNATEDDTKVREMTGQEIINSCHINRGIVYYFNGGNPSGQGMTTVHNSVVGLILLVYIAYVSSDVTEITLLANCVLMVFGDDNLISYTKLLEAIFEQGALERLMKQYLNLSYTVETKDGANVSGRTIWEVSFLKRGFLKVRGVITSPVELGVILETLNWQKKNSSLAQMRERIDGFFCELAQHGKIVFEQWAPLLDKLSIQYYEYSSLYRDYIMAFNGHINYDFF